MEPSIVAIGEADFEATANIFLACLDVEPDYLAARGIALYMPPSDKPQWFEAGPTSGCLVELRSGQQYVLTHAVGHPTLRGIMVLGASSHNVRAQVGEILAALELGWDRCLWLQDEGHP
jgi:hypothetical protein